VEWGGGSQGRPSRQLSETREAKVIPVEICRQYWADAIIDRRQH
jgi:hypothetical protein